MKKKIKKVYKTSRKTIGKKAKSDKIVAHKKPIRVKKEDKKYLELLLKEKTKILKEFLHLKDDALNKSQKEASGDLSGYSYHLADMASGVYETDFILRLAADERERIYAIDDAVKRIEEGIYGKCLMCSKPISKERLNAVPQTEYCLKCQVEHEKKAPRVREEENPGL